MSDKKPDIRRGEMSFMVAIALGLILGFLIKRIRIGMIIGIGLGLLIIFTGMLRSTRR
ncbi:MAG: hypothetical protein ABW007_16935 [Chitinophagaceae bacterium]